MFDNWTVYFKLRPLAGKEIVRIYFDNKADKTLSFHKDLAVTDKLTNQEIEYYAGETLLKIESAQTAKVSLVQGTIAPKERPDPKVAIDVEEV